MCKCTRAGLIIGGTTIAILIILAFIPGVLPHCRGQGIIGPGMMFSYGGGWYMGIFMLVFAGLLVWGIIALVQHYNRSQLSNIRDVSALEILKIRYAKGEINKEEFEEKKKALL